MLIPAEQDTVAIATILAQLPLTQQQYIHSLGNATACIMLQNVMGTPAITTENSDGSNLMQ